MSARRVRHRLGWAPSRISATLQDYLLSFNKQSSDGGKANIQISPGDEVEGILYFVKENDLLILDEYEGVAEKQYKRSLKIDEKNLGENHSDVAFTLYDLASI